VTELAEEFSNGKVDFSDEESAFMAEKGLQKFRAEEYMFEIQGLFVKAFGELRTKAKVVAVAPPPMAQMKVPVAREQVWI